MKQHNLSLMLSLCLVALWATAQPTGTALMSKMDSLFADFNSHDVPGCGVVILSKGKVIFKKSYGMANLEYNQPITARTVFDIASVSKQFTGFAISTLMQEGKIAPDDDIRKYLPDVPAFGTTITIRHLLHHTSGLRDWPELLHLAGWRYDEFFSYEDILNVVKHQKELDFVPGTRYAYSNTGYTLLAAIVEKVSGVTFPDWLTTHIFKPLKMVNSCLLSTHLTIVKQLASSYAFEDDTVYRCPSELTAYGSSSVLTTLDDMITWADHFNKEIATKNPVFMRMLEEGRLNNQDTVHYGYGLGHDNDGVYKRIIHTGGWAGFRSVLAHYPEADFSIIILSNSDRLQSRIYTQKIADLMLARAPKPPVRNPGIAQLPTVKLNTELAKQYTGGFRLDSNWYVMVTLDNNILYSHSNGEDEYAMTPKSDSVYWVDAYNNYITFVKTEKDGYVVKYNNIVSQRIDWPFEHQTASTRFVGVYHSEELSTEYTLFLKNNAVWVYNIRLGEKELYPDPSPDTFSNELGTFKFISDGQKRVTGLTLSGSRIRNVRFDKRGD